MESKQPHDGDPWAIMRLVDGAWTVIERGIWTNPETPKLTHTEVGDRIVVGERAWEIVGYEDVVLGSLMPKVAVTKEVGTDG